ncbi:hypothetical protein P7K49_003380, partial [Saguinus oedipus]
LLSKGSASADSAGLVGETLVSPTGEGLQQYTEGPTPLVGVCIIGAYQPSPTERD